MSSSKVIYQEKGELIARFIHPKCKEFLYYDFTLSIMDSGKKPVELVLKFNGIYPDMAPMPPKENSFKAATIINLYSNLKRWFNKHGHEVI